MPRRDDGGTKKWERVDFYRHAISTQTYNFRRGAWRERESERASLDSTRETGLSNFPCGVCKSNGYDLIAPLASECSRIENNSRLLPEIVRAYSVFRYLSLSLSRDIRRSFIAFPERDYKFSRSECVTYYALRFYFANNTKTADSALHRYPRLTIYALVGGRAARGGNRTTKRERAPRSALTNL